MAGDGVSARAVKVERSSSVVFLLRVVSGGFVRTGFTH